MSPCTVVAASSVITRRAAAPPRPGAVDGAVKTVRVDRDAPEVKVPVAAVLVGVEGRGLRGMARLAEAVAEPAVARGGGATRRRRWQDVEVVASRAATALVVGRVAAVAAGTRA